MANPAAEPSSPPTSEVATPGHVPWPVSSELLLGLAADWLWVMDMQLRIVRIESLNAGRLAPDVEHAVGHTPWESPLFGVPGHGWRRHLRVLWSHQPFRDLELAWRSGGRIRWSAISGVPLFDGKQRFCGYVGVACDITARKQAELAMREARADLDATLRALPDLMFEVDQRGTIHHVHAPQPELLAAPADRLIGRNHRQFLPAEVITVVEQALTEARQQGHARGYRYALPLPQGPCWFELSAARKHTPGKATPRYVLIVRDITELKRREAELSELAFHDPLTGLPNRRLLMDRIEQTLLRQTGWAALLFVDLDNFKSINDTRGHATGDQVLMAFADKLRHSVREADPMGRLGGDEFLVLLVDLGDDASVARRAVQRVARALMQATAQPYPGVEPPISVSVSIGALLFQSPACLSELLPQADALMYRAKQAGKGRVSLRWYKPPNRPHLGVATSTERRKQRRGVEKPQKSSE